MTKITTHFVYAMNLGTFDADGTPLRIFGISTKESFHLRYPAYQACAAIRPVLCGVMVCKDRETALATESAVLKRFSEEALEELPDSEIRLASPAVLDFIENEMEDGETFLGMTAYEHQRSPSVTAKRRANRRAYRQRPEVKAKRREKAEDADSRRS